MTNEVDFGGYTPLSLIITKIAYKLLNQLNPKKGRDGHKLNSHKIKQIHDNYKMYMIITYFKRTTIIILQMCYRII